MPLMPQEIQAPRISRKSTYEGVKTISPTHRLPLPYRRYSWYLFVLEAETISRSQYGQKDEINKNSYKPTGYRTRDLPACRVVHIP
jgi:hypothetical protein